MAYTAAIRRATLGGDVYCPRCNTKPKPSGQEGRLFRDADPTGRVEFYVSAPTYWCKNCGFYIRHPRFYEFGRDHMTIEAIKKALTLAAKHGREKACEIMREEFHCPDVTPTLISKWQAGNAQETAGEENQTTPEEITYNE